MVVYWYFLLQIGYWEVYDGAAIRELEGSISGAINGMHITQEGDFFVTGEYQGRWNEF